MIKKKLPTFNHHLLHPRYWLTWFGVAVLYLLVLLPYPLLYKIGTFLGRFALCFMQKRKVITRRNLLLCFPEMSTNKREKLLQKNFESVGMGIIETGIAWFWPDWRIKRWMSVKGLEKITFARKKNKGILLIGMHFLTLEIGARIFGIHNPGIGVYRTHNNPLLNWLQIWGRMRSNKSMLERSNLRGMIRALKNGNIIWYAPDHDYGPKSSVFTPFFAVPKTATTAGTYLLLKTTKPLIISCIPRRRSHGQGYELLILSHKKRVPLDAVSVATYINQIIEHAIMKAPDQYMWLHRRFKTRPPGEPSLYN
ncbi:lipid A biosynthesis lauroyl/palmitoleoyl acyltransferase [secondary endosymbiont of Heteropsylla cubana]|uniref:Lipid A biosynthesis acyltransferase n=1 Tax=secondary endosymbiont of Heteropsylla cubana TaxID=134287 RepID=J3TYL0_9ENTR|nr:LpxL/LpxP family Kdo(2)-lipid IV(A) lauroyl/palmitoleoyl acyltransferase [secondary endosymbiont of Heteropsylla cubana]AFP85485.1 lipid A biosynthesis lauroyl/palmitoleoyl acyltransferase [secondary endosymbiont of Heteropsylla cubana]